MTAELERRSAADDRAYRDALVLGDATRRGVLRVLIDAAPRPVPVAELAAQFGLHHTAIRQHVARLRDVGLVSQSTMPSSGRGRPRLAFRPTANAVDALQPAARYQELAAMLAEAVRSGEDTRRTGRRVGQRIGSTRSGDDSVAVIVDEAARLGFDPDLRTRPRRHVDVVLRHCPFQDVAAQDPATICQLHLGLAEGVAAALGGVTVDGMDIRDPYRAGCRLHLRRCSPDTTTATSPRDRRQI